MTYCDYKNVLTCKGSFTKKTTDEFIKMTSTFAFMCVDSINNFADIKSFKNIFDTYRKNIDYNDVPETSKMTSRGCYICC